MTDEQLVAELRKWGYTDAADRLERYAGLSPGQRHLSDEAHDHGLAMAMNMSYEGIPFVELTCEDAVALAAIMAHRARQDRDAEAMPRLILPPGMH